MIDLVHSNVVENIAVEVAKDVEGICILMDLSAREP